MAHWTRALTDDRLQGLNFKMAGLSSTDTVFVIATN